MKIRSLLMTTVLFALGACASTPPPRDALYHQFGGREGLEALVDTLLYRVSDDPRIAHHFVDVNIINLNDRLVEFLCVQSGGPCTYAGKDMAEAHKHVKIAEADFNALVEDLMWAMDERKVPRTAQNQLLRRLAAMQRDIVRRGNAPVAPSPLRRP